MSLEQLFRDRGLDAFTGAKDASSDAHRGIDDRQIAKIRKGMRTGMVGLDANDRRLVTEVVIEALERWREAEALEEAIGAHLSRVSLAIASENRTSGGADATSLGHFFKRLLSDAAQTPDERVREVYAIIGAAQIANPGFFTLRDLSIVRDVDNATLQRVHQLAAVTLNNRFILWHRGLVELYASVGLTSAVFRVLGELGLMRERRTPLSLESAKSIEWGARKLELDIDTDELEDHGWVLECTGTMTRLALVLSVERSDPWFDGLTQWLYGDCPWCKGPARPRVRRPNSMGGGFRRVRSRVTVERPEDVVPAPAPDMEGLELQEFDFTESDLREGNFRDADLTSALLNGAKLDNAKLDNADLTRAELKTARLVGASLAGANLTEAALIGATIDRADFAGATLDSAALRRTSAVGTIFEGASLANVDAEGARLRRADLTGARVEGADLRESDLRNAVLVNADLRNTNLMSARLEGADLTGAILDGASLVDARLDGAILKGTSLKSCDLAAASFANADLTDANLLKASLSQANLEGAIWSNTRCPNGRLSDHCGGSCAEQWAGGRKVIKGPPAPGK